MTDEGIYLRDAKKFIELIDKLVPDCGSQVASLATAAERNLGNALRKNEIDEATHTTLSDKIDDLTYKFAYNCSCSKKGLILKVLPTQPVPETKVLKPLILRASQ